MTNQEKEQMVLQVIALKRKGLRICIYGMLGLILLWIGLAYFGQIQLALLSLPLALVLLYIYLHYQKKSRQLGHEYAMKLRGK